MELFGRPLKLVILDVDGVILDLYACFRQNLERAASSLGLPHAPIAQYLSNVSLDRQRSGLTFHDGLRLMWPSLSDGQLQAYVQCFREVERLNPYPPIHGSLETIQWIRAHRLPLALCTTNEREVLRRRFATAGIALEWFAYAVTGEAPYLKPDPRTFDALFAALGVPRDQAVYVGDWYPDWEAARGAGVPFLAVLSGGVTRDAFRREGVPEDHIIERLSDLPNLIMS
jgi:phosphoglycolate phosphatase-like HAD superfamily hydrolase